jgi:hypothetical protein
MPAIVEAQVAGLVEIPVGFVNICTDESGDAWDAFEEAAADALDAEDSDEFFRRIMSGLSQVAGGVGGAASRVRRVAQTTARRAGQAQRITRRAARARSPVGYLVQRLGQYLNEGFDEFDALEDLADLYAEEELDEALPVLAGVAARALVRPLVRRATGQIGLGVRRQIVRSAGQAARTLARRVGPHSVRALPQIVRSIGRSAARNAAGCDRSGHSPRRQPRRATPWFDPAYGRALTTQDRYGCPHHHDRRRQDSPATCPARTSGDYHRQSLTRRHQQSGNCRQRLDGRLGR